MPNESVTDRQTEPLHTKDPIRVPGPPRCWIKTKESVSAMIGSPCKRKRRGGGNERAIRAGIMMTRFRCWRVRGARPKEMPQTRNSEDNGRGRNIPRLQAVAHLALLGSSRPYQFRFENDGLGFYSSGRLAFAARAFHRPLT